MRRVVYASTLVASLGWLTASFGEAEAREPQCVRTAKGKVTCGAVTGSGKTASSPKKMPHAVPGHSDRARRARGAPPSGNADLPDEPARRSAEDEAFLDALVKHRDALAQRNGRWPADEAIDLRDSSRRGAAATRDARLPVPQSAAVRASVTPPQSVTMRPSAVALPPPRPVAAEGRGPRDAVLSDPAPARHVVFADPGRPLPDLASRRPPSIEVSAEIRDQAARARAASHPETPRDDARLASGAATAQPRRPAYPDSRPYADDARQKELDGPAGNAAGAAGTKPDDADARPQP